MTYTWFIHKDGKVSGPHTTETIHQKIASGELPESTSIWWKGQREWKPISFWRDQMQEILSSVAAQTQKPTWYVERGADQHGPLTLPQLIQYLKSLQDLSQVVLWSAEKGRRRPLLEMHDVMEQIGIDRRDFERVPLAAEVAVSRNGRDARVFMVQAASVSKGGIGVSGRHELSRGDKVALMILSPELGGKVFINGEVAYVTETGFAGIRFTDATAEVVSVIHDYVQQFEARPKDETDTEMSKIAI